MKLSQNDTPVLVNCGAYFRGVEVRDADTGRLVWSAGKPQGSSEFGVDKIEIGALPGKDWVEKSPLALDPVPAAWQFVVSMRGYNPEKVTVAHAALTADRVFIFGSSKSVPADAFIGKTCGYDPPIPRAVTRVGVLALGALALAAAAVVGSKAVLRRRRLARH